MATAPGRRSGERKNDANARAVLVKCWKGKFVNMSSKNSTAFGLPTRLLVAASWTFPGSRSGNFPDRPFIAGSRGKARKRRIGEGA